jgi:MFS family permease
VSAEPVVEAASTTVPASGSRLGPLQRRDFRLLVTGQMVSTLGDMVFLVALPFLVLGTAHTTKALSATLTVFGLARIATALPGGSLADRLGPRPVMLAADVTRCCVLTALGIMATAGRPSIGLFVVVGAMLGACEGGYLPAYRSMTPELVPDAELAVGNAIGVTANLLANVVGPPIGGLLVASFAPGPAVFVDAASFAVSVGTLLAISGGRRQQVAGRPDPSAEELPAGGVRAFLRDSSLFRTIAMMTAMLGFAVAGTFEVALPVLARARSDLGAAGYGYLMAALGVGMVMGGACGGRLLRRRAGVVATCLLGANGLLLAALPHLPGLAPMAAAMAVMGAFDASLAVIVLTLTQRLPPPHLRGRLLAVLTFVNFAMFPLSVAVAGAVIDRWSPAAMFHVAGAGFVAVTLVGASSRHVREA